MANVTGPTSNLPGSVRKSPEGMACDECISPALYRVTGECDSFGSEEADLCQEHYDQYLHDVDVADRAGVCDWCKQHTDKLIDHLDYEEGHDGPVYEVCGDCIKKENDSVGEDLEESDIDFDSIVLDDDYPPIPDI